MSLHRLLERQIKRAARGRAEGEPDIAALLDMVDAAYREADQERERVERSMRLMEEELSAVNLRSVRRGRRSPEPSSTMWARASSPPTAWSDRKVNRAIEVNVLGDAEQELRGQNLTALMVPHDADPTMVTCEPIARI